MTSTFVQSVSEMHRLLLPAWQKGSVILLDGPLGVGKTTFVRGYLRGLGYLEDVRSPTFNLLQIYNTDPPVLHADLYRVATWQGIGIEDYLESHVCLIEWPDRLAGLIDPIAAWRLNFSFEGEGRRVEILEPGESGGD